MFEFKYVELMNWAFWPSVKLPLDQQTIMITGPNGSGKTTFLDALRTLLRVPRLSASRRFTDYLNTNVDTSVVKAVISNKVNGNCKRPFEFMGHSAEQTTIAVILRRKSGRWEKRYAILDGDQSLETLRNTRTGDLVSPSTFTHIIHEAGCSESLLKVLALEQGQTDKLCEKSPKDLLDLLLDVHGDKEIIDRYKTARVNYRSAHLEFSQLCARLAEEQAKLHISKQKADEFNRYRRLIDEIAEYENILIPQAEYKAAKQGINMANLVIKDLQERLSPLEREIVRMREKCDNADTESERLKQELFDARKIKEKLEVEERDQDIKLNNLVQERKRIDSLLSAIEDVELQPLEPIERNLGEIRKEVVKLELRIEESKNRLQQLQNELHAAQNTQQKIYPIYVAKFIGVLNQSKIAHCLLCDIVEVTDNRWQLAIESILGRDRFTVIVDSKDQLAARQLAERFRYRGYIVARQGQTELGKVSSGAANLAYDIVQFLDEGVPDWLVELLKRTYLVEDVDSGMKLGRNKTSVTRNGYKQDRRGGISIAVDHFYCGSLGQTSQIESLRRQVSETNELLRDLTQSIAQTRRRETELVASFKVQTALREAEDAAERKELLGEEITRVNIQHKLALEAKRQSEIKLIDAIDALNNFERGTEETRRWLASKREDQGESLSEIQDYQNSINDYSNQLSRIESMLDPKLLRERPLKEVLDVDELTPRYYAAKNLLQEYTEAPDEAVVHIYEKHRTQYEEQQRMYDDHQAGLVNWEREFQLARSKYHRVVDHTIREYRKNIYELSELAGVKAEIATPDFSDNGDGLEDAELKVRFGFDGKRAIDINGNTHSGGQRVVASLILLMSMATSGGINRSGFFIIDEPFAHLSIERIDDISQFLEKSQCQFILTSPTTHNVNVFSAARLQLNFRIKKPASDYAPIPTIIRR